MRAQRGRREVEFSHSNTLEVINCLGSGCARSWPDVFHLVKRRNVSNWSRWSVRHVRKLSSDARVTQIPP